MKLAARTHSPCFVQSSAVCLKEMAQAQLELLRVRKVRAAMLAAADLEGGDPKSMQALLALDRYERYAHTKRRRASAKL